MYNSFALSTSSANEHSTTVLVNMALTDMEVIMAGSDIPSVTVAVTSLQAVAKQDIEAAVSAAAASEPIQDQRISYYSLFNYGTGSDKFIILCGLVAAVISGAITPVFTIILGDLVNAIGNSSKDLTAEVNKNVLRLLYLGAAALTTGYLEVTCCTISGRNQANRVRAAYLENILRQDISWYDTDGSTGTVLQGLNEDTAAFQAAISDRLGNFVRNISTALSGCVIALIRGWQLTLVILAVMPALVGLSMTVSMMARKLQAVVAATNASANNLAQQALANIKTVAAYGMESGIIEKYDTALDAPEIAGIKQGFLSGLVMGVTNGVFFCSFALGIWYGALRVADGSYTGGKVISILMAAIISGWSLGQAMPHLQHFQRGTTAAAHLFALITRKPKIDLNGQGTVLSEVHGDIELDNVEFAYPARPDRLIFDGFSLTIPAGTTVALVGESGSGKSTIIQLIERFYDPAHGQVLLDGYDIKTLQLSWLRSQIALVSQEPTLFGTSIFNNIASSAPGATLEEVVAAATAANAHGFIMRMPNRYETSVGENGGQLSGGQRQRIAIARAILRNPKVLLLDEATSALDAQSEQAVQQALNILMCGRTTVVVAHRLSTIVNADQIAVVRNGKVYEHGTHSDLVQLKEGFYAGMVARQRLISSQAEDVAENEDEDDSSLRKQYSKAKSGRPAMRDSILKRTSVRLSVIPQDILRKLKNQAQANTSEHGSAGFARLFNMSPNWKHAIFGVLSSIALGVQMPGFALALSGILQVYYEPDAQEIKDGGSKWGLIFVAIGLGSVIANMVQGWCFGVMGQRLARRARIAFLTAVFRQDIGWFDNAHNSSGEIMSRLSVDTVALRGAVGDALGVYAQNLALVVMSLAIAFSSSWSLTLVVTAALPLMIFAQVVQASQAFGNFNEVQDGIARANQVAIEAISAIRVVSAYSLQPEISVIYEQNISGKGDDRSTHYAGLAFGVSQLTLYLVYGLAFWYGGRHVESGKMSFEDMMKAFNSIFFVAIGMSAANAQFPELGKAGAAVQRIFSLIDSNPSIDTAQPGAEPLIEGDIEIRKVTFAYPARPGRLIFKEFSLNISAGSSCALVGESGHGKSTIVGLLERFYDPLDGQVLLDGLPLYKIGLKYLRSQIGLVGQEPVMFSTSILENIRIGNPGATISQIVDAARVANALHFIEKLPDAFETYLGEGGIRLSGGQKQRIAIARAILRNPRILVLDEATAALDAESERLVQDALDTVMVGRTTIVIAHRLSTIVNCNKIAGDICWGPSFMLGNHGMQLCREKTEEHMSLHLNKQIRTGEEVSRSKGGPAARSKPVSALFLSMAPKDLKPVFRTLTSLHAAIYRGRMLEEGSHEELLNLNRYYAYLVTASST